MNYHRTTAYRDGYSWVTYCEICSKENPPLNDKCHGEYKREFLPKQVDKVTELD